MLAASVPFIFKPNPNNSFNFDKFYDKYSEIYPNKALPDKSFLEWFIAFSEGDGSFIVNTRLELQFVITQSTSDVEVLYNIKNKLGFGKVILQSQSGNTHRFVVQDIRNLLLICLIFNGNMVFPTRNARFLRFLDTFNERSLRIALKKETLEPITSTILPTLKDNWLAGIIDSEGCFNLSLLNTSKAYRLRFILTQKWEANKIVLEYISYLLGAGKVSSHSVEGVYDYILNGVTNTEAIIKYIDDKGLMTKKKDSYLLWKELRTQIINGAHLNPDTRKEMILASKNINKKYFLN
uniref:LAGLIDADG homing endonuclease n=1 Tax=Cyathus stercoreus TaxID=181520 RepID=UPI002551F0C9|nr:LAGLIDADG homing endonuclease [Cyathus stercoreus]WEV87357.1 LAGLIDADG homing endonuclease [Cyathus stercoreus]